MSLHHPTLGFALPAAFERLVDFARGGGERPSTIASALGVEELDASLVALAGGSPSPSATETPPELTFSCPIFEVVPFGWTGVDWAHYGLLVYAAELGSSSAVVFRSPGSSTATYLGDDASRGLLEMLAESTRRSRKAGSRDGQNATLAAIDAVAAALGLRVDDAPPRRGPRPVVSEGWKPTPPAGWRFLEGGLPCGVLAPAEAFDPDLGDHEVDDADDVEDVIARAKDALDRGFAASALAIAGTQYFPDEDGIPALHVLRDAYRALGRGFLAERVEKHLAHLASESRGA